MTELTDAMIEQGNDSAGAGAVSAVRTELAAAIRRGDYRPNQRLVESELSSALGVSRATIRSALVALEQENYISLERHRGARVRQFSPEEALEILQTREVLESAIAGLAAKNITPDELTQARAIMNRMREAERVHDGKTYSACNREFHALVHSAARHPTLARFLAATPYPLVMSQYRNLDAVHPRAGSVDEHEAILAALTTRNRVGAEAAMRLHVASARSALLLAAGGWHE